MRVAALAAHAKLRFRVPCGAALATLAKLRFRVPCSAALATLTGLRFRVPCCAALATLCRVRWEAYTTKQDKDESKLARLRPSEARVGIP